ncbi:MAG: phosphate ABC transporter substrate-binding protein [Porticoccus sp.]|nr:phosphate ABC transporter substrate-binding protein [Porticoccus sp.]
MIKSLTNVLVLLSTVLSLSVVQADNRQLTLTGSSTVAPLALEIAKRYESLHPDVRIDVQMGGSSRGINDVRMGLTDIGMVSRALKPTEQDLTPFLIAMDGIGIILHESNAMSTLSNVQIIDIYTGKINNWQQLGADDRQITVVNKAEGRSTLELFLQHFSLKNSQIKAQVVIGENQQGIKTVAGNPGAIGYVSIGAAEYEQALGTPIKLLPMAGEVATVESVAKGYYPLSRQLNLVVKTKPVGLLKKFIAFAQSTEVRDLIDAQFFVAPLNMESKMDSKVE